MVQKGFGDNTALIGNGRRRTYKELTDWTNRLAHALVEDYGVRPGNRVLIRSANNPAMVACWLAATKAGAVVVNTMPMLRAGELAQIVDKAEDRARALRHAADGRAGRLRQGQPLPRARSSASTARPTTTPSSIVSRSTSRCASRPSPPAATTWRCSASPRARPAMPKATMHFHRDLLIIADGYAKDVLGVTPDDVFVGSPPLAFTFGLGGLAVFPLRFGAAATLLENASPREHGRDHRDLRATVCFTAPTAYRAMLTAMDEGADLSSLRLAVSAGETLPAPVFNDWMRQDRQADPRWHRRHRDAAHLHLQPSR